MKKIFYIIVISIVSFGCSENFLDKQPEDTLAPGIFFKTADDIKTGVMAAYQPLQNVFVYNQLPHIEGMMSGEGTIAFGVTVWHTHYKDNTNSQQYLWDNFYKVIVDANNIIDIIDKFEPKNDAEAVVINAYRGEACFLRAFAYFYLVRLYGDVPMVVERFNDPGTAFGFGRTSVNEIFTKVIIPDLEYAFANCYKNSDAALASEKARATKGAALTILGKVYLTMNDHANAASTLKKLIVDKVAGDYSLLPDFGQIWLPANKFNSESIFEISYNVAAGVPSFYFRNMSGTLGYSEYNVSTSGSFTAEKDLLDDFVYSGDTRFSLSLDSGFTPLNGLITPVPKKLTPFPFTELKQYELTGTDYNYMITRYADALLMYAEALMVLNQKDAAATYVNEVRARVSMPAITAADLDIGFILHERRMELSFEGHRYWDLIRTGKAIEYISAILMSNNEHEARIWRTEPIPEYQLLLPIPVGEIEKDPTLTQNPGY